MKDRITTSGGYINCQLRDGRRIGIRHNAIESIQTRTEGGTCVRTMDGRVLLLGIPIQDVLKVISLAEGARHAATY
jgi:hypothetical protein